MNETCAFYYPIINFNKSELLSLLQVKIPLESSKDTRDYKDNVLDDNTNGIGGSNVNGSKAKNGKEGKENENGENKLLANSK